jgi:hypothetical protein
MKAVLASTLIPAAAITALIHASPAAATPDTPTPDTTCGTTLESWMPYTLEGVVWHNDNSYKSDRTRIDIGSDGKASWWIESHGEAKGHDRVWIESNPARFRSDRGTGSGPMLDFTLWQPTCNAAGQVVAAHVTTHIPNGLGVETVKTPPGEPLKPK